MPFPLYTMLGYDIVKTQHIFTKSERQVPPSKSKWEKQKNTRKAKVKKTKDAKKIDTQLKINIFLPNLKFKLL